MRSRQTAHGLTVNAVAGTHVVLLGLDLKDSSRAGCLGFAIKRDDHTEGEQYWLRGNKTFRATDPNAGPGVSVSSREHPFQTFQWADYSAKPGYDYTYTVLPLYGTPAQLTEGDAVSVRVATEEESGATHSVWFNRGAVASQEYARRFQNRAPDQVPDGAAYRWLSRGLEEALLNFIGRASDAAYGLYGAVYEFQWGSILKAIGEAALRGATVEVLYDGIASSTGPATKNETAIANAALAHMCKARTRGKIMHNKFFVLTHNQQPIGVWTGSTNLTENGIYGHSNLGHIVEDPAVAQAYLDYWTQLSGDPAPASLRQWAGQHNVTPPNPWNQPSISAFSPRKGLSVLDWYASLTAAPPPSKQCLFMTFAFGMDKRFKRIYERPDGVLRMALLEKEGNGAGLAQGRIDIARIRALPNVIVAVGNSISMNNFDRWLKERSKLSSTSHVRFVHTKYMLIDPLGPNPTVVTGSANFSEASTSSNDENMLIIRGDTRMADIYLGEFMRLYSHYAFREAVKRAIAAGQDPGAWRPGDLIPNDTWQNDYFRTGHDRFLRREYFAGG